MRPAALLLFTPALLAAQALDGGLLDPAWFGPAVPFKSLPHQGFEWVKPGLVLRGRTLRIQAWAAPAWLGRPRGRDDRAFVEDRKGEFLETLAQGLRQGLGGIARVSPTEGDVLVEGRVVDAAAEAPDAMFSGVASLTLDLKLVDAVSGELLAAFHQTLAGDGEREVMARYAPWCAGLGRRLAEADRTPAPPPTPARPALDLPATLARLEALRRDGVLTEEGYQALLRKARTLAAGK